MNKMKSLLLGSAVGLLAVSGAQAADLPAAEPVEYVKVCETYGVGFMYIPGTDTCIKVGGYVRFDITAHEDNVADDRWLGLPGKITAGQTDNDTYNMYVRGLVNFDARTETEYGTLRSFIQIRGNALDQDNASVELDVAFLQFAGFTAGLAPSILDFATNGFYGDQIGDWNHDTVQLAYTHQFGGGVSLTAGVQSNEREDVGDEKEGNTTELNLNDDEVSRDTPAGAVALRVTQGWGEAMVGGLVREVEAADALDLDGEIGWAINGGVKINLPMIAKGDNIVLRAAYGEGATRSVMNGGDWDNKDFNPGFEDELELTKAWSLYAGLTHYWTDAVRSNLVASYAAAENDFGDEISGLTTSANVIWSPVKNLDVGVELLYSQVDDDHLRSADIDEDAFGAIFRIQRNFGN